MISDVHVPEFSWPKIRASYNDHADEVYGATTDLKATIFTEDADAYFAWCDANGDGSVSLYESASCGSKSAFWGPEGESMTSWTDLFSYGTEIAYDFVNILLKYYKNLDLDGSGSLDKNEFRASYAKMSLLAAYVEMDILDTNNDGVLDGDELKTFQNLSVRGANVCLPGEMIFSIYKILVPGRKMKLPVHLKSTISGYENQTSDLETKNVFNLVTRMQSQAGIANVADVYNLSKYNSRIMAAFLPEYENAQL